MNVLIAGGGRTGARLASLLINQNYKVRLVENRRELLGYLHQELPTEVIYEGNPVAPDVLEAAGIRDVHSVVPVLVETFVEHRFLEFVRGEDSVEIAVAEFVDGHEVEPVAVERALLGRGDARRGAALQEGGCGRRRATAMRGGRAM